MNPGDDLERNENVGVVLVHGFGGGVFSWRHVMGELSLQLGCRVVAYDRPGWGLTSRLVQKDWEERNLPNPYKLESQVDLLLSFCTEMGFSSVVLVGHDDGGLLALKAAERVQASTFKCSVREFKLLYKLMTLLLLATNDTFVVDWMIHRFQSKEWC